MILYTKIPEVGNKYFISTKEGGMNPCIPRPNGSNLRFANCVFFAVGNFAENTGVWLPSTNAENLLNAAKKLGFIISDIPAHGALAVWSCGQVGNGSDGAGHVAVVKDIGSDYIVTAESGWSSKIPFWTTTRSRRDRRYGQSEKYTFEGFVWPTRSLYYNQKKDDAFVKCCTKQLQSSLAVLGFMRESEIDGDFGKITLGGVAGYQIMNGLKADGIAGEKTLRSIGLQMLAKLK